MFQSLTTVCLFLVFIYLSILSLCSREFLAWLEWPSSDLFERCLQLFEAGVELLKLGSHHVDSARRDVIMDL